MMLAATVVDPVTGSAPAGWDDFAATHRLPLVWRSELLRTMAVCAPTASSMVLITEGSSAVPVAAFHARHLGPARPDRFARPGRMPVVSMTECRVPPSLGSGVAFAPELPAAGRAEAVRVFERAIRRRAGAGRSAVAYRGLSTEQVPAVPTAGRLRIRLSPTMIWENRWPDLASYLADLPRKRRGQLRRIRDQLDQDETTEVALVATVDPADACLLHDLVRRQYLPRMVPRPQWPQYYFALLNQVPGIHYVTYRDRRRRLLAYVAFHDDGVDLLAFCWGSRPIDDGGRRQLYFDQYLRMLEWGIAHGRRRAVLGPAMEDVKARFGARPVPRWGVVGLR